MVSHVSALASPDPMRRSISAAPFLPSTLMHIVGDAVTAVRRPERAIIHHSDCSGTTIEALRGATATALTSSESGSTTPFASGRIPAPGQQQPGDRDKDRGNLKHP